MKNLIFWIKACRRLGVSDLRQICLYLSGGKASDDCSPAELEAITDGLKKIWLQVRFAQIQREHREELY
jgi:hypothetical protein